MLQRQVYPVSQYFELDDGEDFREKKWRKQFELQEDFLTTLVTKPLLISIFCEIGYYTDSESTVKHHFCSQYIATLLKLHYLK